MSTNDGWSDLPPVGFDNESEALACPLCGGEIQHDPTHDESDEVLGSYAVPDVYTCIECGVYRYAE